jgi:hypothetical protein
VLTIRLIAANPANETAIDERLELGLMDTVLIGIGLCWPDNTSVQESAVTDVLFGQHTRGLWITTRGQGSVTEPTTFYYKQ